MRTAVIEKVYELMKADKNIYFLTGDLGYSVVEKIEKDFPSRFLNVGVAEQNLMGIAAGLALSGKKVAVYSIIPFATMRCFEQIRDDICYHNLNVKILGVGSGLSYGFLGSTHFALEDIGIMRCLPRMTIVSPVDSLEASLAIEQVFDYYGPIYVRIGKKNEPIILKKPHKFKIGKGVVLRKGNDIVIFSTGSLLKNVLEAAEKLEKDNQLAPMVINIHTLKPIDAKLILNSSRGKKLAVTVEEHNVIGALGSAVSEVLSRDYRLMPKVLFIGINDQFINYVGSQNHLRDKLGLSPATIANKIVSALKQIVRHE